MEPTRENIVELIKGREDALRKCLPAEKSAFIESTNDSAGDGSPTSWDHVLDPQEQSNTPKSLFVPLKTSVMGLCPLSSKLGGPTLEMFLRSNPIVAPTSTNDTNDKQETKDSTSARENVAVESGRTSQYRAGMDIAIMMHTIDAAKLAPNNDNYSLFAKAREPDDSTASEPQQAQQGSQNTTTSSESSATSKVKPLAVLAQKVVTETMFHESLTLEANLDKNLTELRSNAATSIATSIQQGQEELESSNEAKRVKVLRQQLNEAESALFCRQEVIREACQERVTTAQQQYDQERAETIASYALERDALIQQQSQQISLGDDSVVCSSCSDPFLPRNRANLAPWERCSVDGCKSAEVNCQECSILFCRRCHAPVCNAHLLFHDAACSLECKSICGYMDRWECLSLDTDTYCGMSSDPNHRCTDCKKVVCAGCSFQQSNWHLLYCGSCDHRQVESPPNKRKNANIVPPWTGEEYKEERNKRRKITKLDISMAPYARMKASEEERRRNEEQARVQAADIARLNELLARTGGYISPCGTSGRC